MLLKYSTSLYKVQTYLIFKLSCRVPEGLEDVSTFPKLIAELLKRGYSDEDVSKVVGKNFLAAMERMEKVLNISFSNITLGIKQRSLDDCLFLLGHPKRELFVFT